MTITTERLSIGLLVIAGGIGLLGNLCASYIWWLVTRADKKGTFFAHITAPSMAELMADLKKHWFAHIAGLVFLIVFFYFWFQFYHLFMILP